MQLLRLWLNYICVFDYTCASETLGTDSLNSIQCSLFRWYFMMIGRFEHCIAGMNAQNKNKLAEAKVLVWKFLPLYPFLAYYEKYVVERIYYLTLLETANDINTQLNSALYLIVT